MRLAFANVLSKTSLGFDFTLTCLDLALAIWHWQLRSCAIHVVVDGAAIDAVVSNTWLNFAGVMNPVSMNAVLNVKYNTKF